MGGVAFEGEKNLDRRVEEIVSVSDVIGAQSVLVTEKKNMLGDEINSVCLDDLPSLCNPEHLILIS
jgi:hypothetical protein